LSRAETQSQEKGVFQLAERTIPGENSDFAPQLIAAECEAGLQVVQLAKLHGNHAPLSALALAFDARTSAFQVAVRII